MFPGRTEYIEKYGPLAGEMAARGYAVITIDWRGQGLAERAHEDRGLGHVEHFDAFQRDADAMMAAAAALDLPKPYYLIAHSMGGCIGLRSLHRELPFRAAAFSSPMWGILIPPLQRPFAIALAWTSHKLGRGKSYPPGQVSETYVSFNPFDGNNLTRDPEMYTFMQEHARAYPDLMLGGPSQSWLTAALGEMRALGRLPAPAHPVVTFLGTAEEIVDPRAIHARMGKWPGGHLEIVEGARHEVLMEQRPVRERFYEMADRLFSRTG
jgi:lysophospholipase